MAFYLRVVVCGTVERNGMVCLKSNLTCRRAGEPGSMAVGSDGWRQSRESEQVVRRRGDLRLLFDLPATDESNGQKA